MTYKAIWDARPVIQKIIKEQKQNLKRPITTQYGFGFYRNIHSWEKGERSPSTKNFIAFLFRAFNIQVAPKTYFFGMINTMFDELDTPYQKRGVLRQFAMHMQKFFPLDCKKTDDYPDGEKCWYESLWRYTTGRKRPLLATTLMQIIYTYLALGANFSSTNDKPATNDKPEILTFLIDQIKSSL